MLLLAALLLPTVMQPLPAIMPFSEVVRRERTEPKEWQKFTDRFDSLEDVNSVWNHLIKYTSDEKAWGKEDYWATPQETFEKGKGDCEDLAIAKYYTLRHMGYNINRLKITFLVSEKAEFHVVLVVDDKILDSRTDKIIPLDRSVYVQTGYAVNEVNLWTLK